MNSGFSRRRWFSLLARPLRAPAGPAPDSRKSATEQPDSKARAKETPTQVAVIQGRFCLAYTSICTICSEHCPEPGAIQVEHGIPMVKSETCTGCGVCHDVCPAPTNAVLVLPRRKFPRLGAPPAR
jgi:Pyruvate/2-oxoacid:ferredoxin oxidoreductase delta subunit